MPGITLAIAQAKLTEYLTAESKILEGQSYSIGDRALTRADLEEIRKGIKYWEAKCDNLEVGRTKPLVTSVIPRDV